MRGAPLPEKGGPGRYDRAAWSLTLRPGSDCSPRQQDDTGKQNPQPAALLQYPSPPSPPPHPGSEDVRVALIPGYTPRSS